MATLIIVSTAGGHKQRCGANCYNATTPQCDCICGGLNHGVGLQQAQTNTQHHVRRIIERLDNDPNIKNWQIPHPKPPKYCPNQLALIETD